MACPVPATNRSAVPGCSQVGVLEHDQSDSVTAGATYREVTPRCAEFVHEFPGAPVELERETGPRHAGRLFDRLDIDPAHAIRPAGSERFHDRLLDGETKRKVWTGAAKFPAGGDLGLREHTVREAVTGTRQRSLDAGDLYDVDSTPDDHVPPRQTGRGTAWARIASIRTQALLQGGPIRASSVPHRIAGPHAAS